MHTMDFKLLFLSQCLKFMMIYFTVCQILLVYVTVCHILILYQYLPDLVCMTVLCSTPQASSAGLFAGMSLSGPSPSSSARIPTAMVRPTHNPKKTSQRLAVRSQVEAEREDASPFVDLLGLSSSEVPPVNELCAVCT